MTPQREWGGFQTHAYLGPLRLRYRQSIILQPPLWWEIAVALNPILRSWTSRFFIMSYSTIPKRICQVKNHIISATDISTIPTPRPMPMTIPCRKACPSGSIVGRNFIQLYPYPSLHTLYTTLSSDCQHLFKLFFVSNYRDLGQLLRTSWGVACQKRHWLWGRFGISRYFCVARPIIADVLQTLMHTPVCFF